MFQRIKRKISVQDSDDSDSAPAKELGRAKKRRLSTAASEDPEENEEVAIGKKAFTEKLQKFKKSPRKKVQCMRFPSFYVFMTVSDSLYRQGAEAN